jgi:hypothetical protein
MTPAGSQPLARRAGRVALAVAAPVSVWVVSTAVFLIACAVWGRSPFDLRTWNHGDASIYVSMARNGFQLFGCPGHTEKWCGNSGWFPGYPYLARLLSGPGLNPDEVSLALAWLFSLASLVLLWFTFLGRRVGWVSIAVLVYVAFGPGEPYHYATYPISMLVFFTILYLWFLDRGRWLAAGFAGIGVVLAYPVGSAILAGAAVFLLLVQRRVPLRERLRRSALALGPAVVAFGLYLLALQEAVGHWNAYLLVQSEYYHQLRTPLGTTYDALKTLFAPNPFRVQNFVSFNEILVVGALVCVIVDRVVRKSERTQTDVLVILCLLAGWLMATTQSHLTYSRGEAGLLFVAILIAKLKPALAVGFAVAAVALAIPMEVSFLHQFLN